MSDLRETVLDCLKKASTDKKEVCLEKDITFAGIYFLTILEYIQKTNEDYIFSKETFREKIRAHCFERKVKKLLNKLYKDGEIQIVHNGGIRFLLKKTMMLS